MTGNLASLFLASFLGTVALGAAQPAAAQDEETAPVEDQRINSPVAEFTGIDKITGRIITFDVYVNETVQFGALQVTPRVCYSSPDTAEDPRTDSFVEVDEITLDRKIRRIFTGWMFAESPGLHAVEHPVFDVWLTSCKTVSAPAPSESSANAPPPEAPAAPAAAPEAAPEPPPPPAEAEAPAEPLPWAKPPPASASSKNR
jgi:hypothetical protein